MQEKKIIRPKIDGIHVPERLREVDLDHARVIGLSIRQRGQLNPVTLRRTPNGQKKLELVAGAHRLIGAALQEMEEIDAIVVKADAEEARLIEIEENLARNDLTPLDRAYFVQKYREFWEKKYGKIKPGNPEISNSANLAQLGEGGGFSKFCMDRLGLSKRGLYRANLIAQLPEKLRKSLSHTPIATNQSQLLKLASLDAGKRQFALAVLEENQFDFKTSYNQLTARADAPEPEEEEQAKVLSRLIAEWGKADEKTRQKFLSYAGAQYIEKGDE